MVYSYESFLISNHFPQWAKVSAQITANHKGFFEFRLCPQNRTDVPASESCMDRCKCLLNAIILTSPRKWSLLFTQPYWNGTFTSRQHALLPTLKRHTLIAQDFISIITSPHYLHDLLWKGMFWRSAEVAHVTCFPPGQVLKTIPRPCKLFSNDIVMYFLSPIKYFEPSTF